MGDFSFSNKMNLSLNFVNSFFTKQFMGIDTDKSFKYGFSC